jgi:hypothetical protein
MSKLAAARRSSTRTRAPPEGQLDGGQESDRSGPHNHDINLLIHSAPLKMYPVEVRTESSLLVLLPEGTGAWSVESKWGSGRENSLR